MCLGPENHLVVQDDSGPELQDFIGPKTQKFRYMTKDRYHTWIK